MPGRRKKRWGKHRLVGEDELGRLKAACGALFTDTPEGNRNFSQTPGCRDCRREAKSGAEAKREGVYADSSS